MDAEGITDAGQLLQLLGNGNVIVSLRCGSDDYVNVTGVCDAAYMLPVGWYSGPYHATRSATFNGGAGQWEGPVGPPGGPYQIDMVYTPPGASSTSTGEAVTTQRHTFKKVEYDNLSNNELKCAQEKLEKYKQTFAHHEDKLEIIHGIEKEIKKAKDRFDSQQ